MENSQTRRVYKTHFIAIARVIAPIATKNSNKVFCNLV